MGLYMCVCSCMTQRLVLEKNLGYFAGWGLLPFWSGQEQIGDPLSSALRLALLWAFIHVF